MELHHIYQDLQSVSLSNSNIDAYSMSPHKWLQAPKGTGMFYVNERLRKQLPRMWYKTPFGKNLIVARVFLQEDWVA